MRTAAAWLLTVLFLSAALTGCERQANPDPPLLILDTDIASDADDVGAVAVLHHFAKQGKIKILAMMVSSGNAWSVPCVQAVNAWFGRPEIPLGKAQAGAVQDESRYARSIVKEFGGTDAKASDAIQLYRRILAAQADQSVTIVSIGYLTNLAQLLQSKSDAVSSLNGEELVRRKAARLICMGGTYPSGREWNFHRDAAAAAYVTQHWPGPVIFAGFELGKDIITGAALRSLPEKNPIRHSYELHNRLEGRPSWDQIAVYYAVMTARGSADELWTKIYGRNAVSEDGGNHWLNERNGSHAYLVQRGESGNMAAQIEQLMLTAQP